MRRDRAILNNASWQRRAVLSVGMLLLVGLAVPAGAGVETWTSGGPEGGTVTALAIDPATAATVYAGSGGGGVWKSVDSGGTWSAASSGLGDPEIQALVINPTTTSTLYVGTASGGVFKSTNSAGTWSSANSGLTSSDVRSLAIDPVTTSTLYAGTAAGIFKSIDSGGSWTAMNNGLTSPDVAAVAVDPSVPATVYAGTMSGGVFKSTNSGGTWSAVNTGLTDLEVRDLVIDPTTSTILYVATDGGGVFTSTTVAISWSAINSGLTNTDVRTLILDPATITTLYAGTGGGVFQSLDSGTTWSAASSGLSDLDVEALAIDGELVPNLYAGTASGGVSKSPSDTISWSTANSGLDAAEVRDLVIDGASCGSTCLILYAGTSSGVVKSANGGTSWADSSSGLTNTDVQALAIDSTGTTLYAGSSFGGGVFQSTNSGATWSDVTTAGLTNTDVRSLVLNVGSSDLLYAGTGGGVFEYDDSTGTWTDLTTADLTDSDIQALATDALDADLLYAGTTDGIFRRDDSTGTWTDLTTADLVVTDIEAVAVDPSSSATIYVGTAGAAVYKSIDGGATWTASSFGLDAAVVQALAIDPLNPSTLYAGSAVAGVYVSGDGGDNWSATNPGLVSLDVPAIVVDPASSLELHAATRSGVFDMTQANADLSITKDDGEGSALPGGTVTYTITVTNVGPDAVTGATVSDVFPDELTGVSWTCAVSGGASCTAGPVAGDIDDTVDLPVGSTVTYTAGAAVDPSASGFLFNSASVTPPAGVYDPDRENNEDSDTDLLIATTDLSITKDDGVSTAAPGTMVTYTLVVSNAGPLDVVDAGVSDDFPGDLDCSWTCVPSGGGACTAGPVAGDIDDTVTLPVGDTLTYTAACTIDPSATGDLENTAEVSPPSGVTESDSGDNEATDTDTLTPEADLSITKDDGVTTVVPGGTVTYTITVSNLGPSDAVEATVSDVFPDALISCSTDCVATGEASCSSITIDGDINDTVNVPVGDTLTYTAVCDIDSAASGSLSNTATVAPASGTTDPEPANDNATDSDTLAGEVDLSITKDDGVSEIAPGEAVTYTLVVSNAGPSDAVGAMVSDSFATALACAWSCEATGGAVCSGPSIQALAIRPNSTSTLFAGTDAGTFRSLDNGDSWSALTSGLDDLDVRAVAVDPVTTSVVYAATAGGVFRSANIGSSWSAVNTGLGDLDVRALAIDPATATTLYAGTASGVYQTLDSGDAWSDVTTDDLTNTDVRALVIDEADPDLLYAATGGGVFRRDDGTGAWSDLTTGDLTSIDVQALALDPADSNLLYAGTAAGIFRRDDGAGAWSDLTTADLTSADIRAVVVDIDDSTTLYLATAGGLFRSADSGASWALTSAGLSSLDLEALVMDPTDADTLYTGGGAGGVFRTEDAAGAWEQATSGITAEETDDIADLVDLPAGATATYTADCDISASASGSLVNTATVSAPVGVTDTDAANDSATDTDTLLAEADLEITKDDGVTNVVPGASVSYTITVSNDGPSDVVGAEVSDVFAAELTCDWTCAPAGGATCTAAGSGDLSDFADIPVGDSVTYTADCDVSSSASGSLENTATVTAPVGVTDTDSSNDSATDIDTLAPEADLQITKDDGVANAVPGASVSYAITVSNVGPSDVFGATVSDPFPSDLLCTWTCLPSGGGICDAGPGIGDIADTVDLPAGATAVYTADCDVALTADGTLTNVATVAAPAGVSDPDASNDSATDVDMLLPESDVSITKDDGVVQVVPGEVVTYTITVAGSGPSNAAGTSVNDPFPAELSGVTWTCAAAGGATCAAAGSGGISENVDLPPGGSVVFTAIGTVTVGAIGDLVNTATVSAPAGVSDPDGSNDSATDTDSIFVEADLSITNDNGQTAAEPGQPVTYTVTVTNSGPRQVTDAVVTDVFPSDLLAVSWTCFAAGGASCTAGPVAGDIDDLVFLPSGASVVYTAIGTLDSGAAGDLTNTATVAAPAGVSDPDNGNNSATDVDSLDPQADLEMTVSAPSEVVRGFPLTYTLTALNNGPDDIVGATVVDVFPGVLSGVSWTCVASPGAACPTAASGSGNLSEAVDLAAGASVVFTATGTVDVATTGPVVNSALVLPPGEAVDPDASNNDDSASTDPVPGADLAITKTDGLSAAPVDQPLTYTIEVINHGHLDIAGAEVSDLFPAEVSACSWSCTGTGGASCTASGSGDIVDSVDLPNGERVTYIATCAIVGDGVDIVNTAEVEMPAGQTDPDLSNNSATDETLAVLFADGFESGDTSAWSRSSGRGPIGSVKLLDETELYSASFEVDQEAARLLGVGKTAWLLAGIAEREHVFSIELRRAGGGLEQRASVRVEGGWERSPWVSWGEAAATLELEWRASWSPKHPDGAFLLSLDGQLLIWLTQLDNPGQILKELDFFAIQGRQALRSRELPGVRQKPANDSREKERGYE